jgi:hypothetical protein
MFQQFSKDYKCAANPVKLERNAKKGEKLICSSPFFSLKRNSYFVAGVFCMASTLRVKAAIC